MAIEVREPAKEHEGTKEMYVSYAVRTRVSGLFEVFQSGRRLSMAVNRRILPDSQPLR